jgi:hypothetical protein
VEGHDAAQPWVSPNDGAQVPCPVGHLLSGVHSGAGMPDVVRDGCGRQQLGVLAQRRARFSAWRRPAESGPTAAAGGRLSANSDSARSWPTRRAALSNASEAPPRQAEVQEGELTNRPTRWRLDVAGGVQLTHGATTRATRYPYFSTRAASLCGSPARGRGSHSVTARSCRAAFTGSTSSDAVPVCARRSPGVSCPRPEGTP